MAFRTVRSTDCVASRVTFRQKLIRVATGLAALLMTVADASAQTAGSGADTNATDPAPNAASDVNRGPDGTTLGTAKSVSAPGDASLTKAPPDKSDPTLLKSNKDIERALKSICRGC